MESSRCSSKTLQKGSCPYAPLDYGIGDILSGEKFSPKEKRRGPIGCVTPELTSFGNTPVCSLYFLLLHDNSGPKAGVLDGRRCLKRVQIRHRVWRDLLQLVPSRCHRRPPTGYGLSPSTLVPGKGRCIVV